MHEVWIFEQMEKGPSRLVSVAQQETYSRHDLERWAQMVETEYAAMGMNVTTVVLRERCY